MLNIYFYTAALDHALVMDGFPTVVVVQPPTCRSESGEGNGRSPISGKSFTITILDRLYVPKIEVNQKWSTANQIHTIVNVQHFYSKGNLTAFLVNFLYRNLRDD